MSKPKDDGLIFTACLFYLCLGAMVVATYEPNWPPEEMESTFIIHEEPPCKWTKLDIPANSYVTICEEGWEPR